MVQMDMSTGLLPPTPLRYASLLLLLTISRAFMAKNVSSLKKFDGVNPDAWLGPWAFDTLLGLLTPYVIFAMLAKKGSTTWGLLLAFNMVGMWNYANSLVTQFVEPVVMLSGDKPDPQTLSLKFGAYLGFQLIVVLILLRSDVISHFLSKELGKGGTWGNSGTAHLNKKD